MKTGKLIVGVLLLCVAVGSAYGGIPTYTPRQQVQGLVAFLKEKLSKSDGSEAAAREVMKTAIHKHMDMQEIAKRSIGYYWSDLGERQKEYVSLMTRYFIRIAAKHAHRIAESEFIYGEEAAGVERARVDIIMKKKGGLHTRQSEVSVRLHLADNEWRIRDVIFDGISIISTINSQFFSMLRRLMKERGELYVTTGTLDALLAKIREKAEAPADAPVVQK